MASAEIYNKALDLLSRREHSRKELYLKLISRFESKEDVNLILNKLEKNKLLSNSRFTEEYVQARRRKGFGPIKISAELEKRGISDSLISAQINIYEDWDDLAQSTFQKRFPEGISKDFKELQKQKNFLSNKGFTFYQIESVLD